MSLQIDNKSTEHILYGQVIKVIGGLFYVNLDDNDEDEPLLCRSRGVLHLEGIKPVAGDRVKVKMIFNSGVRDEGVILEILERRTLLQRPVIANVTQVVVVTSILHPKFTQIAFDRIILQAEFLGLNILLLISKVDLIKTVAQEKQLEELINTYAAYRVITTTPDSDLTQLCKCLEGHTSVLVGKSGVGKSSLLNRLFPDREIATGKVSVKLGHGKHTTRHVELMQLSPDTMLADTPGFSQLKFDDRLMLSDLDKYFVEFGPYRNHCKYRNCSHDSNLNKNICAVINALNEGAIPKTRYESYLYFRKELFEDHD